MSSGFQPPRIPPIEEIIAELRRRRPVRVAIPEYIPPDVPPPVEPGPSILDRIVAAGIRTYEGVQGITDLGKPRLLSDRPNAPELKTAEPPSDLDRVDRELDDFDSSLAAGARAIRERGGGDDEVEGYVYGQHATRFGRRVAGLLREGRRHAADELSRGTPLEEASRRGTELASRHLKTLRDRQAAGELTREADEYSDAYDGLINTLTTPKGMARLAVTTGGPLIAMAAAGAVAGPVGVAAAGVTAGTAAEAFAQKYIDQQPVDMERATVAGLTNILEVPAIQALRGGAVGAIANPYLRRAAGTTLGAAAEGLEESAQSVAQGLVENAEIPPMPSIAAEGIAGSLVGGAIGGFLPQGRRAPGEAPGGQPAAPGAPLGPSGAPGGPGPAPGEGGGGGGGFVGPRMPYEPPGVTRSDIGPPTVLPGGATVSPQQLDQIIADRGIAIAVLQNELDALKGDAGQAMPPAIRGMRANQIALRLSTLRRQQAADIARKVEATTPPPRTGLGESAAATIDDQIRKIEFALGNAKAAGDTRAVEALEAARLRLLEAKRQGLSAPTPPAPPAPGAAGSVPPVAAAPPPAGAPPAAPPTAGPPPGPRGGATVTPVLTQEPPAPGEASPVEAAGQRQEDLRDDVQGLVNQGQDVAAGAAPPGELPPTVVGGDLRGAGSGAVGTPVVPPGAPLPPTGAVPPPPPAGAPPPAPPVAPVGEAPPPPPPEAPPAGVDPRQAILFLAETNPSNREVAATLLQRRFRLPYSAANRLLDELGWQPPAAPVGQAPPRSVPTATPPPPPVPTAEEPPPPPPAPPAEEPRHRRTLRIGRGANGQVSVVFPDRAHADLYSAWGRSRRQTRGEGGQGARWADLARALNIPQERIGSTSQAYRERITEAVRLLDEGAEYEAPRYDAPEEERGPFREAEAPENAVRGSLGRGPNGVGWLVQTFDRDGKLVSESEPYPRKDDARAALSRLQPTLAANRREKRATELPESDAELAKRNPVEWEKERLAADPAALSLEELSEVAARGSRTTAAYRAVRAAHTMGGEVHPGWYDVFPMLRSVPKTGRRGARAPEAGQGNAEAAARFPEWSGAQRDEFAAHTLKSVLTARDPRSAFPAGAQEGVVRAVATGTDADILRALGEAFDAVDMPRPVKHPLLGEATAYPTIRNPPGRPELRPFGDEPVLGMGPWALSSDRLARIARKAFEDEATAPDSLARVLVYASGLSRKGDALAALNWERPFGVDINELSKPTIEQIANAYGQGWKPKIFVDSGAFSAFKRGEAQDLDAVLRLYNELWAAIVDANPNEEDTSGLLLTVPDVIANQAATLESFEFAVGRILSPEDLLFPLQKGELSLADMAKRVLAMPGVEPERVVWGIPSNAAAASEEDVEAFGTALRDLPAAARRVHFLGAGAQRTLGPLVAALRRGAGDAVGRISGDSNRLRATINRAGSREDAIRALVGAGEAGPLARPVGPAEDYGAMDPVEEREVEETVQLIRDLEDGEAEIEIPRTREDLKTIIEDVALLPYTLTDQQADEVLKRLGSEPNAEAPAEAPAKPTKEVDAQEEEFLRAYGPEQRSAAERTLDRIESSVVRAETVRLMLQRRRFLALARKASNDYDDLKNKRLKLPRRAELAKAAKIEMKAMATAAATSSETILKGLRDSQGDEGARIYKRLMQVAANVGVTREKRERPPITNYESVEGWLDYEGLGHYAIEKPTLEEAVANIQEWAPYHATLIADEDLISDLERLLSRIDTLTTNQLRRIVDVEGVGAATVKAALERGPGHPAFQKILDYRRRAISEDDAFFELITSLQPPTHHVELNRIADALQEDLQTPVEDGEHPLLKTFMWGIVDPETNEQASAEAAIGAIRQGTGRLFARILNEFNRAAELAGSEIPFDVPEGGFEDEPGADVEAYARNLTGGNLLVAGGSAFRDRVPVARQAEPSFTIKATPKEPLRAFVGDEVVKIPPRAVARLMGVPDSFPLPPNAALARTILGNGVPPPLMRAITEPLLTRDLVGARPRGVTLFSGAGVAEVGVEGVRFVGAVENNPEIAAAFRAAHPDTPVEVSDVRRVDYSKWEGSEYLHASPVCKNFSAASQAGEDEIDRVTGLAVARAIRAIRPKVVTVENVPEYVNAEAFEIIVSALRENGYSFDANVYDAADYGTPQHRRRLIIRATRGDLPAPPEPSAQKRGWYAAVDDLYLPVDSSGFAPWQIERMRKMGVVEAPGRKYGPADKRGQVFIPDFLESVMSTPQKPADRTGKPAANFADSPLFTQEEDAKARAEEEKNRKAQGDLFSEAPERRPPWAPAAVFREPTEEQRAARERAAEAQRRADAETRRQEAEAARRKLYEKYPYYDASKPDRVWTVEADEFNGRYGPPPRRPTAEQAAARQRWAEILKGVRNVQPSPAPAGGSEGEGAATVERPRPAGPQGDVGGGAARGARGGGAGVGGVPPRPAPEGEAPRPAPGPSRQGIFRIVDPREELTRERPVRLDVIPARLMGNDEFGMPLLSEEQRLGVSRAIEAVDSGSGFLFEDGTGVGKTRELLAVAEWARQRGDKVLIISKASAIEAYGKKGQRRVSGSYEADSTAMGVEITYLEGRPKALEKGRIYIGTYHDLRGYPVDGDTVLLLDEAHQLKNSGQSEVAAAGIDLIRKAKVTVFATATPGDKPYHLVYLTSIGILEQQTGETAAQAVDRQMRRLGATVKRGKKYSKAKKKKLIEAGMEEWRAEQEAFEPYETWQTRNPGKMHRELEKLFERLTAAGKVVKREVDFSPVEVIFRQVPLSPEGQAAMQTIMAGNFDRKNMLQHMRRQHEPYKLDEVQRLTRQELAEGRQVVIFAARVNRSDVVERFKGPDGEVIEQIIMSSEGTLKQLREWLKAEGIEYAEIHGEAEETSKQAQERFQSGRAQVVIATYEKGGTGINLDDRSGAAPRTMVMMTPPFDSTSLVQAVGRVHRRTTRSRSRIHVLLTDHEVDVWNARIIASKIAMLHAVVSGDINLLSPELMELGEEALQAGTVPYKQAVALLESLTSGSGPGRKRVTSAKHYGLIVHRLKAIGVKITLAGGDFTINTNEGYTIEGNLRKTDSWERNQPYNQQQGGRPPYGHLTWDHDEIAPDEMRTVARVEPPGKPPAQVVSELLGLQPIEGELKPIVSERQHRFFSDVLGRMGAVFGQAGQPGSFFIALSNGGSVVGELVPPKALDASGRAMTRADRGGFYWRRVSPSGEIKTEAYGRAYGSRRRQFERFLSDIDRNQTKFSDLYTRHQPMFRDLFGNDVELFTRQVAVTAQATTIRANIALALKSYQQFRLGLPFTGYMEPVRLGLEKLARSEPGYVRGPKMVPYTLALTGEDIDAVAVDRNIGRYLFGNEWRATQEQIELAKEVILQAARELGLDGREAQAIGWAVGKIAQGIRPEEVEHYDDVLIERAAEIRRFRSYFGDAAGPRAWAIPSVRAIETREGDSGGSSLDPVFDRQHYEQLAGLDPFAVEERPLLRWGRPIRTKQGVPLVPGADYRVRPELAPTRLIGSTIREGFNRLGRIDWDGVDLGIREIAKAMPANVRGDKEKEGLFLQLGVLEAAGAVFQAARNPSLEHGVIFYVDSTGKVAGSLQLTSHAPSFVNWGHDSKRDKKIADEWKRLESMGRKIVGILTMHNHPSGDPRPSPKDFEWNDLLRDKYGARYMGQVVIDHERARIMLPDGQTYEVRRSLAGPVEEDPFLQEGITASDFHDSGSKWRIEGWRDVKNYAKALLAERHADNDVLLMFLDSDLKVRTLWNMTRLGFLDRDYFTKFVSGYGRVSGAHHVVMMTRANDSFVHLQAGTYLELGLLQDYAIYGAARTALERIVEADLPRPAYYSIPWQQFSAPGEFGVNAFVMEQGRGLGGDETPPTQAGGGGDGQPPVPPPSAHPEWGEPDPEWWRRRVQMARARTRSRASTAAFGIDPRAFWDAFVLGVDAIRRGLRNFGRWAAAMLREAPNVRGWLRALWNYIRSLGAPVVVERRGRPAPLDEAAGEAASRAPGLYWDPERREWRRSIRPIPQPTDEDVVAAAEALMRGEPVDPGAVRPTAIGRPDDLAININQIADEAGIKEAMTRIIRALERRFARARLRMTEAQLRLLALRLGYTEGEYQRMLREKGALTAPEIIAGRVLRQEAGIDFQAKWAAWREAQAAVDAAPEGGARQLAELAALDARREMEAALRKFIGMMFATAAAGSEAGRALRAHAMLIQSLTPEEQMLRRLFRGNRSPNEAEMARLIEAMRRNDMAEVGRIIRRVHSPGFWGVLTEYYINSLISAPSTPAANVLGNLTMDVMFRTPERGVAARLEQFGVRQLVERVLRGEVAPTERVVGEAMAALRAQVRWKFGLVDALKLSWQALGNEDVRFMQGVKGEFHPPAIPGLLGKIVRTPGRVMEALDIGARYSAMAAERAALVWRKVYFEAYEQGGMTRERYEERVRRVDEDLGRWILLEEQRRADPRSFQQEHGDAGAAFLLNNRDLGRIYKQMQDAAAEATFRDDTTKFTNFVKAARGAYPWLTFVVPFINTPERIMVQAFRRTPVGLAKTLWNIKTGKIRGGLASDRLAQGIMGSMVTAAVYMLAKDGFITGGGPPDPEERRNWLKTGKLPYAIKVGGKWVSLARIEPLATTLGFAADLAEAQDEKIAGDVFDKLHYSVLNNITNKTYLEGMVSAAEAIGDPDRYGARFWKRMVGAAVPNLLAAGARAIDPTIRETDSVKQTLMARVPVLSMQLPARMTGTGEPVVRGETAVSRFVSPFRYSAEAGPEANLERIFLETGYNPALPPKSMTIPGTMGRKIELTRHERGIYARYAQRATAFARTLTTNNDWSDLDVYAKEEILKRIYRFTHDAARRDIMASVAARVRRGEAEVAPR